MGDTSIEWSDALRERFWRNVDATGSGCWEWRAGTFTNGYGQFRVGAQKVKAHRFAYLDRKGSIPDGLIVMHSCDNRLCCNPEHLSVGTHGDNAADRDAKGRGRTNPPPGRPGELNPSAKADRTTVAVVRALRENGRTLKSIGEQFGLSQSQVRNIVTGRCWR